MFELNARSERNLVGVHPDLVDVVRQAAQILADEETRGELIGHSFRGFVVIEGVRTQQRQEELVRIGASWTRNSRHLTGHAVDLAVYVSGQHDIRWEWKLYEDLHVIMKYAASGCGVPIEWGGKWKVRDGPHYQLPRTIYQV